MNKGGPDKFFPHESDTITGKRRIFISQIGIAEVHKDAGACRREIFGSYCRCTCCLGSGRSFLHKIGNNAVINNAVACINGNILSRFQHACRFYTAALCSDNTGNSQFAGYNGSMAGHTAGISHDSDCLLHSGYPIGRRHGGDKNFAFFKGINVFRIGDDMAFACRHARGCGKSFYKYVVISCHDCFFLRFLFFIFLGPDCFRACLENPKAVFVVDSPFHIHIAAVMFFNTFRVIGQLGDLFIAYNLRLGTFRFHFSFFHIAAFFADQFDGFFIDAAGSNGKRIFIHNKIIGCYGTLHDVFAKPPGAFDHDAVVSAGRQVDGEHDTCRFRISHHLDGGGKRHIFMVKVFLRTVINGTVGESGRIAFLYFPDNHIPPGDVQVCILLPGKRSIRQIFRGSRGADGDERILFTHLFGKFFISLSNLFGKVFRHSGRADAFTDFCTDFMELYGIFHILQFLKHLMDFLILSRLFHEIAVCAGCCRISVRNRHIHGRSQFPQRRGFPSYQSHVGAAQLIKPQYISIFSCVHHDPP